jgi:transcriptional regulator of aroF, aroG, tyrA and aromatic amino acid transport
LNLKLALRFKDRVGIVADVSAVIAEHGLNIVSMEVQRLNESAYLYLAAENGEACSPELIFEVLGRIPDLSEIRVIETLPFEERENRFRVVLDNISDGVVSIDREGKITIINRVARDALQCESSEVIGQDVACLKLPDHSILECLRGKEFSNIKQNLITETGRYQYFTSGRPIRDSYGHIIGAVEIAKDMQAIKKLAQTISEPSQISFSDIIGNHPSMQSAILFAQKIAATDAIVCIRGASGTGKELFAQAIHTASKRRGPFVPVNCAALPEQLLESELFGYAGGAFTGARREGKPGLFEIANEGTIFLDEIAEMSTGSQAKLLRVIQEKTVRRLSGSKEFPINARIVTATNRNLEHLVEEKAFRQDLYYRINVLPIHIPPLVERIEDIPALVEQFLFQIASKLGKTVPALTESSIEKLKRHNWPGNVRELKNVVERAAFLAGGDTIDGDCILFSHEIGKAMGSARDRCMPASADRRGLKNMVAEYEKQIIAEILTHSKSIREAAKSLEISHTALLNKLKKIKLKVEIKQTIGNKANH